MIKFSALEIFASLRWEPGLENQCQQGPQRFVHCRERLTGVFCPAVSVENLGTNVLLVGGQRSSIRQPVSLVPNVRLSDVSSWRHR